MKNQVNKPENVQEVYEYWLTLPNLKKPGQTNNERSATDKANTVRAVRDFTLGLQDTEDLAAIHASFLGDDPVKIQEILMRGMEKRLGRKAENNQYASSIRSRMNGFLRDVRELFQSRELRPEAGKRMWKPYRQVAARFSRTNWPTRLTADFEDMVFDIHDEYYVGTGQEYLLTWKPRRTSLEAYAKSINRLVRYMLEVEGLSDFGLAELTDYDRIQRYRRYDLGGREKGGHDAFSFLTTAVAAITRYLVIVGKLSCPYEPFSKDKNAPWIKLYALGRETLKQGREAGKTNPLEEKKSLTIEQMLKAADFMLKTKPRSLSYQENPYQVFRWYMAAIIFRLMTLMPLRQRNWINMKWGDNLRQNADGQWEIYFRPHELKNGQTGNKPREYFTVFPAFVTAWIEQWREILRTTIGPDFEERCPYVFPSRSRKYDADNKPRWVQMKSDSLGLTRNESLGWQVQHAYIHQVDQI